MHLTLGDAPSAPGMCSGYDQFLYQHQRIAVGKEVLRRFLCLLAESTAFVDIDYRSPRQSRKVSLISCHLTASRELPVKHCLRARRNVSWKGLMPPVGLILFPNLFSLLVHFHTNYIKLATSPNYHTLILEIIRGLSLAWNIQFSEKIIFKVNT